ncbi:MAG: O-antigen ligase family protein [Spirochaetes bacterium]|nr:O-antigen ligase family protein [Spirochaetota bacterium]
MKSISFQDITSAGIKYILLIAICLVISVLMIANPKMIGLLSFIFCVTVLFWMVAPYLDEIKVIIPFIFILHLLPMLAGIRIHGGLPVFKPQRIVTLILLFYLFRKELLFQYYSNYFRVNIFTRPVIFILISYTISSFLSNNFNASIFFTISFILEYLFLAILVFSAFKDDSDIDFLARIICYSTMFLCMFGIVEKITEFNFFHIFGVYLPDFVLHHQMREGGIRISGPFTHSISFSVYLVMTIPLFLYRYRNRTLLFYFTLGISMLTILFTQSRTGMISSMLVLGIYVIFIDRMKIPILIIFSVPIIVLYHNEIIQYLSTVLPFVTTSAEQADSTQARLNQLAFLWDYIKNNIVFGVGQVPPPGMLVAISIDQFETANSIDNFYLLYTYYYGIFGLLVWLFMAFMVLFKSIRVIIKKQAHPILTYIVIGIISFLISNTVVALWESHLLYWIYIGIATRIIYNSQIDAISRGEKSLS